MSTFVEEFDNRVAEALEGLPGVDVFRSRKPDDVYKGKSYLVIMGGDVIPGAATGHKPLCGVRQASFYHTFGVYVVSVSASARTSIVSAVRRRLYGFRVTGVSGEVEETGAYNASSESDPTVRPVRYTAYLTFKVLIDRMF